MNDNSAYGNGNIPVSFADSILLDSAKDGKLSIEDVRKLYIEMEKNLLLERYTFPAKKSSDGYYHLWVADASKKGGRRQIKAKTIGELKDKAYQHEKGINGQASKTFKDVFEIVQSEKLRYVKDGEKRLSVMNTVGRSRSEYKRYFAGTAFERKFISDISKRDVEEVTLMNLERYDLKKKGFLSFRGILKSVFRLAFEEYWIPDNVYDRVDFKKYNDMLVRDIPIAERVHSDMEMERIMAFIHDKQKKRPNHIPSYALELQIAMGLRRGEVPPLMWSDIQNGAILISKEQLTVKKGEDNPKEFFAIVHHTKTWKDRKFPVTDEIQELLGRIHAVHERIGYGGGYLFPADNENGVITNNTIYNFYRRMCAKLNIPISRECVKGTHSFRRNAITQAVNKSGGNILMASQLFGNTPDVAENHYYAGLDLDEARTILEA